MLLRQSVLSLCTFPCLTQIFYRIYYAIKYIYKCLSYKYTHPFTSPSQSCFLFILTTKVRTTKGAQINASDNFALSVFLSCCYWCKIYFISHSFHCLHVQWLTNFKIKSLIYTTMYIYFITLSWHQLVNVRRLKLNWGCFSLGLLCVYSKDKFMSHWAHTRDKTKQDRKRFRKYTCFYASPFIEIIKRSQFSIITLFLVCNLF